MLKIPFCLCEVVSQPLRCRGQQFRRSARCHALLFILPALAAATLINLPTFFEAELVTAPDGTVFLAATALRLSLLKKIN